MAVPSDRSPVTIFTVFLRLGTTSFGGPIAHVGYLRREFVERRQWLDEARFGQLLAMCQVLPGPASSQLGFGIGLLRGGWRGGLAAFAGFTLPSALLLAALASLGAWRETVAGAGVVHGLMLVSVAVVAHSVLRMAGTLAPDTPRRLIAGVAAAAMLALGSASSQLAVIVVGALLGVLLCRGLGVGPAATLAPAYGARTAWRSALLCAALVLAAVLWRTSDASLVALAAVFVRAGALVFGGGHVVLPLLEASLVGNGWMTADTFLAGYGAAQAVPGPLFSVAAFLGTQVNTGAPTAIGALVATLAIFAPGFLLLVSALPAWAGLRRVRVAGPMIAGVNAAVVGLLAAALYDPIFTSAVRAPADVFIAGAGFAWLHWTSRSPLWVVAWCVAAAVAHPFLAS